MGTLTIDPVNRIEGHQKWVVQYDNGTNVTTSASVHGMMFRGFEAIMLDRDPRDSIIMCGRI